MHNVSRGCCVGGVCVVSEHKDTAQGVPPSGLLRVTRTHQYLCNSSPYSIDTSVLLFSKDAFHQSKEAVEKMKEINKTKKFF